MLHHTLAAIACVATLAAAQNIKSDREVYKDSKSTKV